MFNCCAPEEPPLQQGLLWCELDTLRGGVEDDRSNSAHKATSDSKLCRKNCMRQLDYLFSASAIVLSIMGRF